MTREDGSGGAPSAATAKLLIELGPLAVFYGVYIGGPKIMGVAAGEAIFYATGAFMAAFAAAFVASWARDRRIAPMLMISGAIVLVMGSLTILLKNQTFIYMKPTIVNLTFAGLLGGGLLANRLFLKVVFNQAFTLPDPAWRTLTYRFVGFFVFLALLNEVVWRAFTGDCIAGEVCAGERVWVDFKTFGVLPLTLIFTMAQTPFIMAHNEDPAD